MRIILAVLHFSQLRNFTSVVLGLAERGHEVLLAAEEPDSMGGLTLAESLASRDPRIRIVELPNLEDDPVVDLGTRLRVTLDYFRFHEEPYASAPKLRERLQARVPRLLLKAEAFAGRRRLVSSLTAVERALPVSDTLSEWLREQSPDVLLLGSLTHYRSAGPELHRASAALGIPTAACIYSWDHLSSKALLRRVPDAVLVWNEMQADEAVRLHGVPRSRVVVTGAQCYDQWNGRTPSRDHAAFSRAVGLDPARRFVLYVCSALTPSPDEPTFVRQWIDALRRSDDPTVASLGILIRPHPERVKEWAPVASLPENVVVHAGSPLDEADKREYFNALYHADAVVGLVTSAFLEAALVGRPVFTIALPRFAVHQQQMQHFRYLLDVEGGLPEVAETLSAHVRQLQAVLGGDTTWRSRQERFLRAFVCPHGRASGTGRFVDAVEVLGAMPVPATVSAAGWSAGLALRVARIGAVRNAMLDGLESEYAHGIKRKAIVKRQKARAKRRRQFATAARGWLLGRRDSHNRF